ncbi:hypothetical protein KL86DES1_22164 [uncultured Desulfovibrio sp.]|uniref:Uncharacterized protein n=1 Tax=uncultured Desulfovibrio sp. TaxID=167968 RepID=A0A212LB82_9BACT|nr:hypothetical protein KL86DES1_22164 [uncultured Desulfovibrio sp.]
MAWGFRGARARCACANPLALSRKYTADSTSLGQNGFVKCFVGEGPFCKRVSSPTPPRPHALKLLF